MIQVCERWEGNPICLLALVGSELLVQVGSLQRFHEGRRGNARRVAFMGMMCEIDAAATHTVTPLAVL